MSSKKSVTIQKAPKKEKVKSKGKNNLRISTDSSTNSNEDIIVLLNDQVTRTINEINNCSNNNNSLNTSNNNNSNDKWGWDDLKKKKAILKLNDHLSNVKTHMKKVKTLGKFKIEEVFDECTTIIDLRSISEYRQCHLRTAINIPANEFPAEFLAEDFQVPHSPDVIEKVKDLLEQFWVKIAIERTEKMRKIRPNINSHRIILYDNPKPNRSRVLNQIEISLSNMLPHVQVIHLHGGFEQIRSSANNEKYLYSTNQYRQSQEYLQMDDVDDAVISEVLPFLFVSGAMAARSKEELEKMHIDAVINVMESKNDYPTQLTVLHRPLHDQHGQDLIGVLEELFEFIDEHKNKNKNVLVHCARGQSRSVAIVIAYLMKSRSWSLLSSYLFVKNVRPWIGLNPGFISQLSIWGIEKVGSSTPFPLGAYTTFEMRWESFRDNIEALGLIDDDENRLFECITKQDTNEAIQILHKLPQNYIPRRKKDDSTCLHLWIESSYKIKEDRDRELLHLIIETQNVIEVDNIDGRTPLHMAVENCDFELIRFLIDNGATTGNRDIAEGRNELHIAVRSASIAGNNVSSAIISYLLENTPISRRLIIEDVYHMTPIDYANMIQNDALFYKLRNRYIAEVFTETTRDFKVCSLFENLKDAIIQITNQNVCYIIYNEFFASEVIKINKNDSTALAEILAIYNRLFPNNQTPIDDCIFLNNNNNNNNNEEEEDNSIHLEEKKNEITAFFRENKFSPHFNIPYFMSVLTSLVTLHYDSIRNDVQVFSFDWSTVHKEVRVNNDIVNISPILDIIAQSTAKLISVITKKEFSEENHINFRASFDDLNTLKIKM